MKLLSQLEQVDSATPFARRKVGKISRDSNQWMVFSTSPIQASKLTSWHGPWDGSPRSTKCNHIKQQERCADPSFSLVCGPVRTVEANQDSNDYVRHGHEYGSSNKEFATADAVHGEDAGTDSN